MTPAAAPGGQLVFVGGVFRTVNGVATKGLVQLNLGGQEVSASRAVTTGPVRTVRVFGSRLYVGGSFTKIRGVVRQRLAVVDASTGAVDPNLNLPVTGQHNGGTTSVSPARCPAERISTRDVGNFSYVHVDISPDSGYFVLVTTGGWVTDRMCDTAARWETGRSGSGQQPTWIDYTGGDTLWSVAITGAAVYAGGHQRYLNNPLVGPEPAPGPVSRPGIGAYSPATGIALSWNPTRTRGVGAFALVSTAENLWVGSVTTKLGRAYHGRLGMFPLP